MDKGYFLEYFELERKHWWFIARRNILRDHIHSLLKGRKNVSILNIGAATGATSLMLAEFGNVTSVEYDSDCCLFLKGKLNIDVINASITELPFNDNTFELVCAFDVIEHVEEHEKAAGQMKRVCKNDGIIACTVPAYQFLWGKHDEVNHHVRRYTKTSFMRLFNDCTTLFSSYFNCFLFPLIALLRMSDNLFRFRKMRKDSGSDFSIIKSHFLNSLFFRIMNSENALLKRRISLPFGVSLLFSCRNTKGSEG